MHTAVRRRAAAEPRARRREAPAVAPVNGMSQAAVLALQRTAGNQAVTRLMREATDEAAGPLSGLEAVQADSAAPDQIPPGTAELRAPGEEAGSLGRSLQRVARARLQRKDADTKTLAPRYWRYDSAKDVNSYNCAGLAWRSYTFRGDLDAERSAAAAGTAAAKPGVVKHWFWEYDIHLETDDGRRTSDSHDFHTVAGVLDNAGADPDDVYSKNGHRPVFGPGTGPGWKPPARDRATSNDPSNTPATAPDGAPLYKVRTNFKEVVKCHPYQP